MKPSLALKDYRSLLGEYLRPQLPRVLLMGVLLLAGIGLQLVNPQIIRFFLDTAGSGGAQRALLLAALLFIGFALGQNLMTLAANYASQVVSWTATNRLRTDLALHCLRLDMPFHKRHTPGELIERIDGDVTGLANFLSQFVIRVLGNGLLVLGILILLYRENLLVGLGLTLFTGLTLVVLGYIQKLAVPRWAAARQASAEQYGFIEERISGAEDIRAAGAEPYMLQRLYVLMRAFLEQARAAFVISSLTYNLTNLVFVAGYAAGLALGVYLYIRHQATIGTAYLIVYYVGMLSGPLQSLREQVQDLQQATASLQRIREFFALRPHVMEPLVRAPLGPVRAAEIGPHLLPGALAIEFQGISFRYDDHENGLNENVLNGISFSLQPGRVLGILGRTGSGKSTLTRLLFRLYDPTQGAIRLGGLDIRSVPLTSLRQRVGMVTQDVQLFQATIRDNLAFFDASITDAQIENALKELRLWSWVQSLPEGLNTLLLAGGQGLSAGEAQLLAFTRVFLKNPGLVILDEASSRLDPATENLMERAVDHLFEQRTGLIVAHRLKTVERADDILILEEGCVVEYGPRQELASDPQSRLYRLLQTGLEEALV